jgi:hypothetical protein
LRSAPTGHLPGTHSVAASLPRHGGVKPPLRHADLKVSATTAGTSPGIAGNPAKPFTQEQVSNMMRDGFGDESGAKLIEQRGIDFAPAEDFCLTLKAAGASEAFLKALRAAKPPEPSRAKKPINQVQVFALLAGQVPRDSRDGRLLASAIWTLLRQGIVADILSGGMLFHRPAGMSREIPQVPWGNSVARQATGTRRQYVARVQ